MGASSARSGIGVEEMSHVHAAMTGANAHNLLQRDDAAKRLEQILMSPEADGRYEQAKQLAFGTDISAALVIKVLAASHKVVGPPTSCAIH
jgi:hypothetical protein